MKRRLKATLALCISLLMVLSIAIPALARPLDIKGHWAEATIDKWLDKGWIKGYTDGSFGPDKPVTRGEFFAFVNRSNGFTERALLDLSDVKQKDWFAEDIYRGIAAGYLKLPDGSTANPKGNITREDAAVLICRIVQPVNPAANDEAEKFKDVKDISVDKRADINKILTLKIMKGFPGNLFKPKEFVTRAQGVVILEQMLAALTDGSAQLVKPIKSITASNGGIKVVFNGIVKGLTKDDFTVTAKLDGKDYTLGNLVFNTAENSFSFNSLAQTASDKKLDITLAANVNSAKIYGSASATLIIKDKHNFIIFDCLNYSFTHEGVIDWCDVKFKLLSGMASLIDVTVSLYDGDGNLLAQKKGTNIPFDEIVTCSLNVIGSQAGESESEGGQSIASLAAGPAWEELIVWNPNREGMVTAPQKVVIEANASDGHQYAFDSQDTVWITK